MTGSVTTLTANQESAEASVAVSGPALTSAQADRVRVIDQLFRRFRQRLLGHVAGLMSSVPDAEEIVQETCARRARGIRVALQENELSDGDLDPGHIVGFEQCMEIIKRTLLEIPARSRQVYLLRTSEQLSYPEIAKRLGVSTRTVEREMRYVIDLCQQRLQTETNR